MTYKFEIPEGAYFMRREPPRREYDQSYYLGAEDPDGETVDQTTSEYRDRWLDDHQHVVEFINGISLATFFVTGNHLLDIGAGVGHLSSVIDGHNYNAVESSEAAREILCGNNRHKVYSETYAVGSESMTVVTMLNCIEHMDDPDEVLSEAWRVLRPGGYLIVRTPDFDSPVARMFGENFRLLHDPTHISLFSEASLREIIEDNWFEIDHIHKPFYETRHFDPGNLLALYNTSRPTSPPAYGNIVEIYARKPRRGGVMSSLRAATHSLGTTTRHLKHSGNVLAAKRMVYECIENGGKVLVCGNGGSCADAAHFAAELVGRMGNMDRRPLPAIALNDPVQLSALANDIGSDMIFRQQVHALGERDDVLIAISTSGCSQNIVEAVRAATSLDMGVVVLTGENGLMGDDRPGVVKVTHRGMVIKVPSNNTQRIQEMHAMILHAIAEHVEECNAD